MGPSEQARGHWNGNKCWDQDIENIGEEEERWGTNCDPLEIDDGQVSPWCPGDGNGRGNDANGGAVSVLISPAPNNGNNNKYSRQVPCVTPASTDQSFSSVFDRSGCLDQQIG